MPRELAVLPVYRHEEARSDQGQHQFQLFLAAVPGNMDVLDAFVDHLGAAAGHVVHHPADRLLVAGNLPGREHHDVVTLELDVTVVVDGDAGKCRLRLALRPGADAHHVLRRIVADLAVANLHPRRNAQVSQPLRNLRVLDDAPADERDLAVELRREVQQELDPVASSTQRSRRQCDPARW